MMKDETPKPHANRDKMSLSGPDSYVPLMCRNKDEG
jgi:hypothetical protein